MKTGTAAVILAGIVIIAGITYSFIRQNASEREESKTEPVAAADGCDPEDRDGK